MTDLMLVRSPDIERANRIPPGQSRTDKWPVLHYGRIPDIMPQKWTFTISGLVQRERTLTLPEFAALPQVKVLSDIHCVTRWSRLDNLWEGVSAATVRDLAQPRAAAGFVIVEAAGGFTTNLKLEDFLQPDVVFALKHDGKTISPEHGYPVRLVVPRLYLWKSAKWVTGLRFVAEDSPGFWEKLGYHNRGDPWREERYASP